MHLTSPVLKDFSFKFNDDLFIDVFPNPNNIPYIQKNQSLTFYLKLHRKSTDEDRVLF